MFRKTSATFAIMAILDYVTTISVRFIATGDLAAVPIALVFTMLWCVGVTKVERDWRTILVAGLGAAFGTYIGLLYP